MLGVDEEGYKPPFYWIPLAGPVGRKGLPGRWGWERKFLSAKLSQTRSVAMEEVSWKGYGSSFSRRTYHLPGIDTLWKRGSYGDRHSLPSTPGRGPITTK
ncbi:hypothetical protein IF2G_06283 [Cordyceps javanica]|nr:hypothetical protein IF2G_06283 [Cordyceps javanica]